MSISKYVRWFLLSVTVVVLTACGDSSEEESYNTESSNNDPYNIPSETDQ